MSTKFIGGSTGGSTGFTGDTHTERPCIARMIHTFAVPIILFWVAIAIILSLFVPSLEVVGQERSVSLSPTDAPSMVAMKRIGHAFNEGETDSSAMIVLESDQPLGDDVHRFYDVLIRKLREDKTHVLSVQDFWGDPLTAAGAQSNDGKATTVQVNLAGNQGEPLANESVQAVRKIVASTPPPPGVKAYVTGVAALAADLHHSGDKSMLKITATTVAVILIMLLFVYRSVLTVILLLVTVGFELTAGAGNCRGVGASTDSSDSPPSRLACSLHWQSPPVRTTGSSSLAATKKPARPAKTEKWPSTPCTAGRPMSSWAPD